jgi:hypothetical protein
MKATAVLLVVLITVGVFGPCVIVSAEASGVPHEDPNAAQGTLDSLSFLAGYADIFALMANGQYANASQLSEQLSHISVPADLSYLINRYNNLTQQLIDRLNDLDVTLDNASRLLDQYRLGEARDALDHAGVVVAEAQILLGDLKEATSTVSQKIGVFSAAAGDKIKQAYAQLQNLLDRLQELMFVSVRIKFNVHSSHLTNLKHIIPPERIINESHIGCGGSVRFACLLRQVNQRYK